MQYGKQLVAAATYLSVGQFLPEDRLGQLLADLFGVSVSTGTMGPDDLPRHHASIELRGRPEPAHHTDPPVPTTHPRSRHRITGRYDLGSYA